MDPLDWLSQGGRGPERLRLSSLCAPMLAASPIIRRAALGLTAGIFGSGFLWSRASTQEDTATLRKKELAIQMPQRDSIVNSLRADKVFDVLVIGGGATGTGVALVRQSRRENATYMIQLTNRLGVCHRRSTTALWHMNLVHAYPRFLSALFRRPMSVLAPAITDVDVCSNLPRASFRL